MIPIRARPDGSEKPTKHAPGVGNGDGDAHAVEVVEHGVDVAEIAEGAVGVADGDEVAAAHAEVEVPARGPIARQHGAGSGGVNGLAVRGSETSRNAVRGAPLPLNGGRLDLLGRRGPHVAVDAAATGRHRHGLTPADHRRASGPPEFFADRPPELVKSSGR
jgi:hypothetical protein